MRTIFIATSIIPIAIFILLMITIPITTIIPITIIILIMPTIISTMQ